MKEKIDRHICGVLVKRTQHVQKISSGLRINDSRQILQERM
jgi:hypothetical protein